MMAKTIQLLQKNILDGKTVTACFLASGLALASTSSQAWSLFNSDDPDAKDKANVEIDWQLPPPPAAENLLPFFVNPTTHQSFAIDSKSLTADTDGVVRYTVVGTSSGGAKNISFEGIRCSSYERRIYAFGHADGTWARARNSEWQPIAANLQHAELAQNYFCKNGLVASKVEQILQTLRYHRPDFRQM